MKKCFFDLDYFPAVVRESQWRWRGFSGQDVLCRRMGQTLLSCRALPWGEGSGPAR